LRQVSGGYALVTDTLAPVNAPQGRRFATVEDSRDRVHPVELGPRRYVLCASE
jgi:hypothetical protein